MTERGTDTQIKILHASLGDFLGDPARAGALYMNPGLIRADISRKLLHFMQQPKLCGE